MLILFDQEQAFEEMSAEDMENEIAEHMKWIEDLGEHYDSGEALLPDVKSVNGKNAVITDGPFTESKEIVGGFYILNAESFEKAVELSKGCPVLKNNGRIEVREVMKM
jgi:hypothetical protein